MPVATLKFNLPKEQEEFDFALRGSALHLACWQFHEWLRSRLKYDDLSNEEHAVYDKIYETFNLYTSELLDF